MADLAEDPDNFEVISGRIHADYLYGETVTPGQQLRLLSTDDRLYLADASVAGEGTVHGLSVNNGSAGTRAAYVKSGAKIDLGTTLAKGEVYTLSGSGTPGKTAPVGDLGSGKEVSITGVASTTAILDLHFHNSGITI